MPYTIEYPSDEIESSSASVTTTRRPDIEASCAEPGADSAEWSQSTTLIFPED
jgi:hypothetical protein